MTNDAEPSPLEDFWTVSSLGQHNAAAFGAAVRNFEPFDLPVHPMTPPGSFTALPRTRDDRTQRLLSSRRSGRQFSTRSMETKTLSRVLTAVGHGSNGALVPAAGGVESIFHYVFAQRAEGEFDRAVLAYSPHHHGLAVIAEAPPMDEVRRLFSLECSGDPQIIVVSVLHLDELRRKYGDRALRFALQQVGHGQQNLGLRAAEDSLTAYILGGALDREVLDVLGLGHTSALVGGAMAIGYGK